MKPAGGDFGKDGVNGAAVGVWGLLQLPVILPYGRRRHSGVHGDEDRERAMIQRFQAALTSDLQYQPSLC